MVTSSIGDEGTEIDPRTYQWDVSKTQKTQQQELYIYIYTVYDMMTAN